MRVEIKQILILILLAYVAVQVFVFSPKNFDRLNRFAQSNLSSSLTPFGSDYDQRMRGVHLIEAQSGNKVWEMWADRAQALKSQSVWELKEVLVFFYSQGEKSMEVRGETATIRTDNRDLEILGNVTAESKNGYLVSTSKIKYQAEDRLLLAKESVRALGPSLKGQKRFQLESLGLIASLADNQIDLLSDVKSSFFRGNEKYHVDANSARLSLSSRLVSFFDRVQFGVGKFVMKGPTAVFKFEERSNDLAQVALYGGVKGTGDGKSISADRADIDFQKDQYVFRGAPRLLQETDEIQGDLITFLDGGKIVKVEKATAEGVGERP